MLATHERDGAERAGAVAAFGYLEISVMFGGCQEAFSYQFGLVIGIELFQNEWQRHGAKKGGNFRDLFLQVVAIPLTEATGNIYLIQLPAAFELYLVQDGIDAFFLSLVDKSAGVDHHDIMVKLF